MMRKCLSWILLASIMISVFIGGCGKKEAQVNTDQKGAKEVANLNKTGMPIAKEKVTLRMVANKRPTHGDYNEMKIFKDMEQKTNVHIEWDQIPNAQYIEKKNILLASGEYPDAFYGAGEITVNDVLTYGPNGVFIPLENLMKEYAPRISAVFNEHSLVKKVCTMPDGHVYTVPAILEDGIRECQDNMFMYKPWLDKLGLSVPKNKDELYNVLKAFKTKDPNGNGKADEIPFSFYIKNYCYIGSLYGMFGRVDNLNHLVVENGKVVFTPLEKTWKDAIQYFHGYFKEGLIDQESFVHDQKQYYAKGQTPDAIIGSFMAWNDFDVAGVKRKDDYVIVPPMEGINGKRVWSKYNGNNGGINLARFVITNKNKYPEITMRWVDEFYDKKTSVEVFYGPVGTITKEKADGTFDFMEIPKDVSYDEFRFKQTPGGDAPMSLLAKDFGKIVPREASSQKKYEDTAKYYQAYLTGEGYPGLTYTLEENQKLQSISMDIMKYVDQMHAKWLMDGGIENDWDSFQSKLKQMKVDEMLKIYQTAYDRFMSVK